MSVKIEQLKNKQILTPYTICKNDDNLALYFIKNIGTNV